MYMSAMKGKGLTILNIYTDNLWMMGDKAELPLITPILSTETKNPESNNASSTDDDSKVALADVALNINNLDLNNPSYTDNNEVISKNTEDGDLDAENSSDQINHENVLEESFLCAIKFKYKEFKLPIIVSTFVKIMQTCW
jgi:hypothetical protein